MAITLRVNRENLANFFDRYVDPLGEPAQNLAIDPNTFTEAFVDGVSVEFTQTRYVNWDADQYYITIVIPSYTEDLEQHVIRLVRYSRDDMTGEEFYQNHYFYTQFKERKLLTMIGNHLFRDEEFEKPLDLYFGLLTSINPPIEVPLMCSGNTPGTTDEMATNYKRQQVIRDSFKYVMDIENTSVFGNHEYIRNTTEIVFPSMIENLTIIGMGIFLTPFDLLPIYTTTFAYPIDYKARRPDPTNQPAVQTWMTPDVIIRGSILDGQFRFSLESLNMSMLMKRLISEHVFLEKWISDSLASDYRLSTKPTGFYIGLITQIEVLSETVSYYHEPTRTDSAYARVFYASGDEQWSIVSDGVFRNSNPITFAAPTANWGTVIGYAVYRIGEFVVDSNVDLLFYKPLTTPVTINSGGSPFVIAANALTLEIS